MKKIDLVGTKFNDLEVISELPERKNGHRYFKCQCKCGNSTVIAFSHIRTASIKSCGCALDKPYSHSRYFTGVGEISFSWWRAHVLNTNLDGSKSSKRRTSKFVEVTINEAWDLFINQNRKCALSGVPLEFSNRANKNTASLDRIDSTLPYLKNNVQWVHKHINFMKGRHTDDYFIELCKKVAGHND